MLFSSRLFYEENRVYRLLNSSEIESEDGIELLIESELSLSGILMKAISYLIKFATISEAETFYSTGFVI